MGRFFKPVDALLCLPLAGLAAGSVVYLRSYIWGKAPWPHAATAAILIALAAAYVLCLLLGTPRLKARVLALTASAFVATYLVEGLLGFSKLTADVERIRVRKAKEAGVPFDTRSRLQVIRDKRKSGEDWQVSLNAGHFFGGKTLQFGDRRVLPLAGIPNTNVLVGNETGEFSTFRSDEFGFNGPAGIWKSTDPIQAAFLGDSFTLGCFVREGESFADRVRRVYPRCVNLGGAGNGPLVELATMREYLRNRRVGFIFWVYYEGNDLSDLGNRELQEPILVRYLKEPGFIQGLATMQPQLTSALRATAAARERESVDVGNLAPSTLWGTLFDHTTLSNWRAAVRQTQVRLASRPLTPSVVAAFQDVLEAGLKTAVSSGARLVFVYLPAFERYSNDESASSGHRYKSDVLGIVRSLGIDAIDSERLFSNHPNPRTLYPFSLPGHYTPEGHEIIADAIIKYLHRSAR